MKNETGMKNWWLFLVPISVLFQSYNKKSKKLKGNNLLNNFIEQSSSNISNFE